MLEIEKGIKLKDFSTFRIGGTVEGFCRIKNEEELREFFALKRQEKKPYFILGGGSNVLFSDQHWAGWVAKVETDKISQKAEKEIICDAGLSLARLVNFAKEKNLSGLEWAVGIPGTVGGAIRGNAGAFGGEMKDSLKEVRSFDFSKEPLEEQISENSACQFDYRTSLFKKQKNLLIWEAVFSLKPEEKEKIAKKMQDFLEKRASNQPALGQFPSAGSVFENPQSPAQWREVFEKEKGVATKNGKLPAGWLIEKCGLKGKTVGGAQVSSLQANFIVNLGAASSRDVLALIALIKDAVREKFGIELQEEIEIFQ